MNPVVGELLGYACGLCTTFTFLPQTIKSIRTRNVSGLSWMTYTIYCIGCALWILYGVYLKSLQIILFDGIALLFGSIMLYLIVTNKKSKKWSGIFSFLDTATGLVLTQSQESANWGCVRRIVWDSFCQTKESKLFIPAQCFHFVLDDGKWQFIEEFEPEIMQKYWLVLTVWYIFT